MQLADITSEFRAKLIIEVFDKWVRKEDRVLDVGCGNGIISDILKRRFDLQLVGCDILNYSVRNINFVPMIDKDKLPFKRGEFQAVMLIDALHHVENKYQEGIIKEALRVGKRVLIFELKPTFWGRVFDLLINKIHNPMMGIPFSYKSKEQWGVLFDKLQIKWVSAPVRKPLFYPFEHVAYCLEAKR